MISVNVTYQKFIDKRGSPRPILRKLSFSFSSLTLSFRSLLQRKNDARILCNDNEVEKSTNKETFNLFTVIIKVSEFQIDSS